jgi:NAD(P)-dependent dehydrogenase (short-subunit alcohol dehydrogenase family)
MTQTKRPIALITGASGGMGRGIARRIGATMDLFLTDVAVDPLTAMAKALGDEGYEVTGCEAGDLADPALLSRIVEAVAGAGGVGVLVHTAGLSPAQADWRKILHVNVAATQVLLDAVEPVLAAGAVGVLIASMGGYRDPGLAEADRLLDETVDEAALDQIKPYLFRAGKTGAEAEQIASQLAYVLSKRAVIRLAERRAARWGERSGRIVSISPGVIYTPMGVREAESNPQTKAGIQTQPVSRWGTAMDIAAAVEFLISPGASFITGCDLRVDGGSTALTKAG